MTQRRIVDAFSAILCMAIVLLFLYLLLRPSRQMQMLAAVHSGSITQVRELIADGVDPDFLAPEDVPESHIQGAVVSAVNRSRLLTSPICINLAVGKGDTALTIAARNSNMPMVSVLLQSGANPSLADGAGRTPLHWACYTCNWPVYAALKAAGADDTTKDSAGLTPKDYWRKRRPRQPGAPDSATPVTSPNR
jgi:ankyrin repeat protein